MQVPRFCARRFRMASREARLYSTTRRRGKPSGGRSKSRVVAPIETCAVTPRLPYGLQKPSEKAVVIPLRPHWPVGDRCGDVDVKGAEILCRLAVDRLLQIIARRVVTLGAPPTHDVVLRRIPNEPDLQRQRRHAGLDEAVLIAARKGVALGLGIGQ